MVHRPVLAGNFVQVPPVRPLLPGGCFQTPFRPTLPGGLIEVNADTDPLIALLPSINVLYLAKREYLDFYGMYENDAATDPVEENDDIAVWKDLAKSGDEAAQIVGAERPTAVIVGGLPFARFAMADANTLVTPSEISTVAKSIGFILKRNAGGDFRIVGTGFATGMIRTDGSNVTMMVDNGGFVQDQYGPLLDAITHNCIRIDRLPGGAEVFRNGNPANPTSIGIDDRELTLKNLGGAAGSYLDGDLLAFWICDVGSGAAVDSAIRSYIGLNSSTRAQYLCVGDSLTNGIGGDPEFSYPNQLQAMMPEIDVTVYAVNGVTVATLLTTSAVEVDRNLFGPDRSGNKLGFWAGSNDLVAGRSAVDIYADIEQWCSDRRSAAVPWEEIVIYTPIVRGDLTAPQEAERVSLRGLIIANAGGAADATVDLEIPPLMDFTDLTYFDPDEIHLENLGYTQVANAVHPIIAPFFPQP